MVHSCRTFNNYCGVEVYNMSLGDDSDFANENFDDTRDVSDDCPTCSGTGDEYEGDMLVGECASCGGSGILDT